MKKTRLFLLIAGILCGAGILLCAVSFAVMGWDYTRLDPSPELEQKIYSISAGEVREVVLDSDNCAVEVMPSADGDINVVYYMNVYKKFDAVNEGGRLRISYEDNWKWEQMFQMFRGLKSAGQPVLIQVPAGFAGDVSVESENGRIVSEGIETAGALLLDSENAGIRLSGVSCASLRAGSENGSIKAEDIRADSIVLSGDNASVTLTNAEGKALALSSKNGRVTAAQVTAAEQAKLKSENGAIKLEAFTSPNMELESENGSISGTITGRETDYQISSTAGNGSSNLENRLDVKAPYMLQAKTKNGSIRLQFTGE